MNHHPSLFLVLLVLAGCATPPRPVVVSHTQTFGGDLLEIHPPASGGWEKIQESESGIAFAKGDRSTSESLVANVAVFGLPPTNTPAELEALIQVAAKEDTDPNRFTVQEQTIQYSDERAYPCVRYHLVSIDKSPVAKTSPLILELEGLYCRHPVRTPAGFAALFSHRGQQRYPALRDEAEQFIQSVRVPGH